MFLEPEFPDKVVIGVYLLYYDDTVVYVGQSINCYVRIKTHWREGQKIFNSYEIYECEDFELDYIEQKFIYRYRPEYNKIIDIVHNYSERRNLNAKSIRILAANILRVDKSKWSTILSRKELKQVKRMLRKMKVET